MECQGSVLVEVSVGGPICYVDAIVSSDLKDRMLVSWGDLQNLGILPKSFPYPQTQEVKKSVSCRALPEKVEDVKKDLEERFERLKVEFSDVFSDDLNGRRIKCDPVRIELREGAIPRPCMKARPIPVHWREMADKEVQRLIEQKVISRMERPGKFVAPGHFVEKGDGTLRYLSAL